LQQYNSSNAPPWMNNQPVPMDVGRSRAPPYQGLPQGCMAGIERILNLVYFNCGQKGHMAKQCLKPKTSRVNQAQNKDQLGWTNNDSEIGYPTLMATTEQSTVSQLKDQLKALILEQQKELANEMGVLEDFSSI
jgi:hypothetical protein